MLPHLILPRKHTAAHITIFTKLSGLAAQYNAINLSQGFPDFPIDPRLGDLLAQASQEGYNQYAPMAGLPLLRAGIAQDISARYSVPTDADNHVTVIPGATYGLFVAISCCISAGDEVIILEPAYDSYWPAIEMNGGIPVPVALDENDFSIDWGKVTQKISPKTKAILVNTPNNPTGVLWTADDREQLAHLAEAHNLMVISDEVYEQLVFDEKQHHSVWQHEALRDRCVVVFSFGKVYQQTGWKMGYVLANENISQAFRRVHQYLCFSVNSPSQYALAQYLQLPDKPNMTLLMQAKRDYFLNLMKDTPFTFQTPAGGSYFQVMDYTGMSDLPDTLFAEWLTQEIGVAVIPLSAFYHRGSTQKRVRFCFAKKEETLERAVERIRKMR